MRRNKGAGEVKKLRENGRVTLIINKQTREKINQKGFVVYMFRREREREEERDKERETEIDREGQGGIL